MTEPLRVLSLSTLYPNVQHPNFGVFVERQMQAVAKRGDVDLTVINPIGLPPFPLSLHRQYRQLRNLPQHEQRGGVQVLRPRFTLLPKLGARLNAGSIVREVLCHWRVDCMRSSRLTWSTRSSFIPMAMPPCALPPSWGSRFRSRPAVRIFTTRPISAPVRRRSARRAAGPLDSWLSPRA